MINYLQLGRNIRKYAPRVEAKTTTYIYNAKGIYDFKQMNSQIAEELTNTFRGAENPVLEISVTKSSHPIGVIRVKDGEQELSQDTFVLNSNKNIGDLGPQPFRHRLYSDPQEMPKDNEKLQPIRRHSNINVTNLQSKLTYPPKKEQNNNDNNQSNVTPHFERSGKRKMSQQYYMDFGKSHTGNNDFLAHLASSLNREKVIKKLDYEELKQKYIPKYVFDWRYVDNPQTGGKCWRNLKKI